MPNDEPHSDASQPPTLLEIFSAFFAASIVGFGGVLPWARRMLVEQRRWLTEEEFVEVLSLGQFLPGGNIVNVAVVVGDRFRGPPGAVVALLGLLTAPCAVVVLAGALYLQYQGIAAVHDGLGGVASAAVGLILATGLKFAEPQIRKRAVVPLLLALAAFAAVGLLRLPLPVVVLLLAPIGIADALRRLP